MRYVVAYDVSDDKTRNRVAEVLEGFGHRVQWSVFECVLEAEEVELLLTRLAEVLENVDQASVRLYRLCRDCEQQGQKIIVGASDVGPDEMAYVVR